MTPDLYLIICFPLIILHLSFIRWVQYFISYRNYWGVSDAQQKASLNPFWTIKSKDAWLSFSYMCTYLSWYENYAFFSLRSFSSCSSRQFYESIFCHVWYTFQYFLAAGSILFSWLQVFIMFSYSFFHHCFVCYLGTGTWYLGIWEISIPHWSILASLWANIIIDCLSLWACHSWDAIFISIKKTGKLNTSVKFRLFFSNHHNFSHQSGVGWSLFFF